MDYEQKIELDNTIKSNNLNQFKKLMEAQQDDDRYLPLETALNYNRTEMVKFLVEQGAYIHDDMNSLAIAASHANIELIGFLYEHAENIGDDYNGSSIAQALESAACSGSVKAMEFILSLYDRSKVTPGYDPIDGVSIWRAIESKDLAMLKALIQNGANPNVCNGSAFKNARGMKRDRKPCRKLLSILSYLEDVKKDLVLYRAIFENKTGKIERLLADEQRKFCKETKAWLKHGTVHQFPGFEHAQKIYRLGILNHKLQRKLSRPSTKTKVNKI